MDLPTDYGDDVAYAGYDSADCFYYIDIYDYYSSTNQMSNQKLKMTAGKDNKQSQLGSKSRYHRYDCHYFLGLNKILDYELFVIQLLVFVLNKHSKRYTDVVVKMVFYLQSV